ncbi:hypothetical protein ACIQD5_29745 [Streptomyces microflavus]|uniref:hypothetical protein n=1 Tax=Streptomyces microflavus TaxID=1919 RepID=UPI00381A1C04
MVPTQRSVAIDLQDLDQQIPDLAREHSLIPLNSAPAPAGPHVMLSTDTFSPASFMAAAHQGGARFLYYESDRFSAEAFAVIDPGDDDVEEHLDSEAKRKLKRIRRAAKSRHEQLSAIGMCFVADGVAHYWFEEAPWFCELQSQWEDFMTQYRVTEQLREEDEQARIDSEIARIAEELQDRPDFRAATKRSHHRDIARTAYPPPADADDEDLQRHQRVVDWATTQAAETVERAARRIYAAHELALQILAEEITHSGILAGATTVAARTLLIQDFLAAKSDGYAAPKRTIDLLLTKVQLLRPKKSNHSNTPDQLQLI